MALPEFEDLPFYDRPDLTPYLVHLTKNSKKEDGFSAFEKSCEHSRRRKNPW